MPNDYYALMEALQRPQRQRQQFNQQRSKGIADIVAVLGQQIIKEKIKKDMEKTLKDAEAEGKKVSYQIDPNTGMITPTISTQSYEAIFEAAKAEPDKYEVGRGAKGQPTLKKKKQIKPNIIAGIQSAIGGEGNVLWPKSTIKNPVTGEEENIDITNEEDVSRVLAYHGIEDWRSNPELIEAGVPAAYDKRIGEWKTKQEQLLAGKEPKIQPFAKGVGRVGGAGAYYGEAVAKYGEGKTTKIVDTMVKLQKQGKSIKEIRKMLEEAGADADVFLKAYEKR